MSIVVGGWILMELAGLCFVSLPGALGLLYTIHLEVRIPLAALLQCISH